MADIEEFKEEILSAISQVQSASNFAVTESEPRASNPGLLINDLGVIGFPLSAREAQVIIGQCNKSHVGKGSQTIRDDSVRSSWELSPSQFLISNPEWNRILDNIVSKTCTNLGLPCDRSNVRAELYKLLIYEKGAFFKEHQDSEKAPGMFGTLVIALPSEHEGGQVVLRHNKQEVVFDSAERSTAFFGASYAAWYANVYHEVKPVTSGYRVVLTYNLIQSGRSSTLHAIDNAAEDPIKPLLIEWKQRLEHCEHGWPPYLIYQLEHKYSEQSLEEHALKGDDYHRVRSLVGAASGQSIKLYLGTIERIIHKDDEAGDEIFDTEESFREIVNLDGSSTTLKPQSHDLYHLNQTPIAGDDSDYEESEHEGYTGNEGAPSQFWYRDAVVLIVPDGGEAAFSYSENEASSTKHQKLTNLRLEATNASAKRSSLFYLCEIIMRGGRLSGYGYSGDYSEYNSFDVRRDEKSHDSCLDLIAAIAVEQQWWDIYKKITRSSRRSEIAMGALAAYVATNGVSSPNVEIKSLIFDTETTTLYQSHGTIDTSVSFAWGTLRKLRDMVMKHSLDRTISASFQAWCKDMCKEIAVLSPLASHKDSETLSQIATDYGLETVEAALQHPQNKMSGSLLVHFVVIFSHQHTALDERDSNVLAATLQKIWTAFYWFRAATYEERNATTFHYYGPRKLTPEVSVPSTDVIHLLNITNSLQPDLIPYAIQRMTITLRDAIASPDYYDEQIMSFLQAFMKGKVPALSMNNSNRPGLISGFIEHALQLYIRHYIGAKPVEPQTWQKDAQGCGNLSCSTCNKMLAFLRNPNVRVFEEKFGVPGRKHLDQTFKQGSMQRDLVMEIKPRVSPMVTISTKYHRVFEDETKSWNKRHQNAVAQIQKLSGDQGVDLKPFLGRNSAAFASGLTQALPPMKPVRFEADTSLKDITDNQDNRRGNKRSIDILLNPEDSAPRKRNNMAGEPEVIDLT